MSRDNQAFDGMTDEEIEALAELDAQEQRAQEEGADDPDVTAEELQQIEQNPKRNEEPGQAADDEEEEVDDPEADDANAEEPKGNEGDGDEHQDDEQEQEPPAAEQKPQSRQPAPLYVAEAPEGAQERLEAIAAEKGDLVQRFDEGDITAKEYQAELDALNKEERGLERKLDQYEISVRMAEQQQVNEREAVIDGFMAEVGINRDATDPRFVALNQSVMNVAADPAMANASVREIMEKAYDVLAELGMLKARGAKAPATEQPKQPEPPKKSARKAINAPPTLAKVPASDATTTSDGNRFAHLARIKDPDAYERAFAALSPADQDAFLQQGA